MAQLLDGNRVSAQRLSELKLEIAALPEDNRPCLAVILVGGDPASAIYVNRKQKTSQELGIRSIEHRLPDDATSSQLADLIASLNADMSVHGILLQVPLPAHLDADYLLGLIDPEKDVDGFHPVNIGQLLLGRDGFRPCTPAGVIELLRYYQLPSAGKHVVIVGRSNIVGKPQAALFLLNSEFGNATVTVCHSKTQNLADVVRTGDIVVAAIGRPEFISRDMVKPGAIVIDVGINRVSDNSAEKGYRVVGDVEFKGVSQVASWITPVPGGVGPMTIAMLMQNTYNAFQQQKISKKKKGDHK